MEYEFNYNGGVIEKKAKFLLFPVVEGKEMFFSEALRFGLIQHPRQIRLGYKMVPYFCITPYVKIFFLHTGNMGMQITQSFYLEISHDENANTVTITHPENSRWGFQCKGKFLRKKEILGILSPENPSVTFIRRERLAPKQFLRSIIKIEKPKLVLPKGRRLALRKRKES